MKVPATLIVNTLINSEVAIVFPLEFKNNPAEITPAQFNTICTPPNLEAAVSNNSYTLASSVTLVLKKIHLSAPYSLEMASPLSTLRSAITTLAPYYNKSLTAASPNPEAPPVTTATVLLSIFIFN